MKHILLPTDFSDVANNAFLYALKLANQLDLKLYVLYSYSPIVISSTHAGQPELVSGVYEQIEMSKFEFFKKQVPSLHQLADENNLDDSHLVFLFEQGSVLSAVHKVLSEEEIGLVVMGTHGASGITASIIGSNTVNVIKNIKQPVLAIPEKAKYAPIHKVAFTTLFKEKDIGPLTEIIRLANIVKAQVLCVNVMQNSTDPSDILLQSDTWRKKFDHENLDFVFLEKKGSVEETINTFIAENHINLLAVVKRNRSFFDSLVSSSLANKLAFHTETPIMVFHEEK